MSALLLGGNVTVKKGQDRGGDFQHIPAVQVRARSSAASSPSRRSMRRFRPTSRFGRTSDPNLEVLCVNPSQLGGGLGSLDPVYPTEPFAPGLIATGNTILGIPPPTATTPWVEFRSAYRARCSSEGGANVLQVTPRGSVTAHPPVA